MVDPNEAGEDKKQDESSGPSQTARGYDAAITFAVEVALPTLVGYWADGQLGWLPVLTLAGLALGFGAGLYHLVRTLNSSR